jgi:uncharacterized delta-60 repeat protein
MAVTVLTGAGGARTCRLRAMPGGSGYFESRRRRWPAWLLGVVLAGALATGSAASVAAAAPGELDTSFNGTGKLVINFGGEDRATQAAITPDGRIVVVGTTTSGAISDYALARVNASGTLDKTFSGDGLEHLESEPSPKDTGGSVVVLPDESIVVTGQGKSTKDFFTEELNPDGSKNESFAKATGGASTVDFGGEESANDMVRQPDGKLVIVGSTSTDGGDFAIARLNADGTLDTSFGNGGKQTANFGGTDAAEKVALTAEGKIVIVGEGGSTHDMAVTRLNSDGSIDKSFGSFGEELINFGGTETARGVAIQVDGKIVVEGSTDALNGGDVAAARLNPNGGLDSSFNGNGKLTLDYGLSKDDGTGVAIQQNGRIVVMANADPNHDFVVTRLNADGSIDSSFGTSGTATVDYGGDEFDGDVVLQPDGNIVLVGSTDVGPDYDMAVTRLIGDPPTVTPPPSGGGTSSPPPPPQPQPQPQPIAVFQTASSGRLPFGTGFDGRLSKAPFGQGIVDYHWILTGPGPAIDTDCGTSPLFSAELKATGIYKMNLIVTTNSGLKASNQVYVSSATLKKLGGGTLTLGTQQAFSCENPAAGNQSSSANCVKSFGFGILDVNSRGSASDCFEIAAVPQPGKPGYLQGKVAGPVAINGLYVPVPKGIKTEYDSNGNVAIANLSQVSVRIGPFLTKTIPLKFKITPNREGIYHLINVEPATNTPKFLGSLPISGLFAIDLIQHASRVRVGIGLPSPLSFGGKRAAQGQVNLISDNVNGLHYDGLSITVPDLWLGPIFVSGLNFNYTKSTDTWGGAAKVTLPGAGFSIDAAGPPTQPADFGFGIKNGKLDHVGFAVDFTPPAQPDLFPPFHTALLSHIGAAVGFNPLRLTGTIGISAANLVEEDGALFGLFASAGEKYTMPANAGPELAPLASRTFDRFSLAIGGTAKLKVPLIGELPLLNAYGLYEYPDYFEFGGGFEFGVSFLKVKGGVHGFAYPSDGTFNLAGGIEACARGLSVGFKFAKVEISPCLNVGGVVSSKGIGFCGVIPIPFPVIGTIPVPFGVGYKWGGSPDPMFFSCDYTPYEEKSKFARVAATPPGGASVTLAGGLPAAMIRLVGQGGAPEVSVTDPKGNDITKSGDALIVQGTDPDTTLVAFRHPLAGAYTITPQPGSPAIASVATATGLPPLNLKASVGGAGQHRVLRYKLAPAAGRIVKFVERGPGLSRVLGAAKDARGTIRFTPATGSRGQRTIVALIEEAGAPSSEVKAASYTASATPLPGRPRSVAGRRRGGKISISWSRVAGASRYEVLVKLADGSQTFRVVRGTRASLPDAFAGERGTLSVDALRLDGTRGPARSTKLTPVRTRHG